MTTLDRLFAAYVADVWARTPPKAKDRALVRMMAAGVPFARIERSGHPLVSAFLEDAHAHLRDTEKTGPAERMRSTLHRDVARSAVRIGIATRKHVQTAIPWRPSDAPLGTTFSVRRDLLGGARAYIRGFVADSSWRGKIERLVKRKR